MTISKAFTSGQFFDMGAPAAILVSDDGSQLSSTVKSLDFRGDSVKATADAQGNVVVNISQQVIDKIDGGTF